MLWAIFKLRHLLKLFRIRHCVFQSILEFLKFKSNGFVSNLNFNELKRDHFLFIEIEDLFFYFWYQYSLSSACDLSSSLTTVSIIYSLIILHLLGKLNVIPFLDESLCSLSWSRQAFLLHSLCSSQHLCEQFEMKIQPLLAGGWDLSLRQSPLEIPSSVLLWQDPSLPIRLSNPKPQSFPLVWLLKRVHHCQLTTVRRFLSCWWHQFFVTSELQIICRLRILGQASISKTGFPPHSAAKHLGHTGSVVLGHFE